MSFKACAWLVKRKGRVAALGKGSLGPLFERLLAMGFAHLTPAHVTTLTSSPADNEDLFEPPNAWPVVREISEEALNARASDLLAQGPVLLIPPWERRGSASQPQGDPRRPLYVYEEVLRACRPTDANSVIAFLTPMEMWVSDHPTATRLRQDLEKQWDVLLVLYCIGMIPAAHPSFAMAAAFLRGKGVHRPPLKLFKVTHKEGESAVEKDFDTLLTRRGGRTQYGYVIRDRPQPEESLDFDRHDPNVLNWRADLAGFGSLSTLGDLCTTVPRIHLAADAHLISSEKKPGAVRLLKGHHLQRNGTIAQQADDACWVQPQAMHLLEPGDLVIRAMYSFGDPHGLVVAQVTEQDLPAAAAHTTLVLRPHVGLEYQRILFAAMFLRTPLARTLVGRSKVHVPLMRLLALPVPQPDDALMRAFDDLNAARLQLEDWQKEADSLLESVFMQKTAAKARSKIIDRGRALRLRVEAASLLDDLGHTVRTRFPYPIAYRWRETEARMSAGEPQAAYSAVLDAAEILLCYAAQVALALGRDSGIGFGAVKAIREKLASGRSGPGLGDWAAVLHEVASSRQLSTLPTEHPLHDIRGLLAGQDAADARQRLSDRRNDQAHLRRIDPVDLPAALRTAFTDLTILIERAHFFADYSFLHVTDVRWDTLEKTAHVYYRELMGDHPVVPTRTMTLPSNDLETGSLYLRDSDHQLHLLRPFLIGQDCPTCRAWSTFHVDRVPHGRVLFKSLEHGHVFEEASPAMPAVLAGVGLL